MRESIVAKTKDLDMKELFVVDSKIMPAGRILYVGIDRNLPDHRICAG